MLTIVGAEKYFFKDFIKQLLKDIQMPSECVTPFYMKSGRNFFCTRHSSSVSLLLTHVVLSQKKPACHIQ